MPQYPWIGQYWAQIDEHQYESQPGQPSSDRLHDCTLTSLGRYRNATITFAIKALSSSHEFHAAVLFRKNGVHYLGAGLGGWGSYYSLFHHTERGFSHLLFESERKIQQDQVYHFEIEVKSGFIRSFAMNGEALFPSPISLRDSSLRSYLRNGHIGLYAWDQTTAQITLTVTPHPTRCFIITNIEGRRTDKRRQRLQAILADPQIEFLDSRDLSRDYPLMTKIRKTIMESDLVLADFGFGKPRGNVYYETGIAHSVGVPTIHIGPRATDFSQIVSSDMKAQFYILEEELDAKLHLTVTSILDANEGNFDYLGE